MARPFLLLQNLTFSTKNVFFFHLLNTSFSNLFFSSFVFIPVHNNSNDFIIYYFYFIYLGVYMIHAIYNLFLSFEVLLCFNLPCFIYVCLWFDVIKFVTSIWFICCYRVLYILEKILLKTTIWSSIFLFRALVMFLGCRLD